MIVDDFVGIPWLDGGRTADGCDCWGLMCLVLAANGVQVTPLLGEYRDVKDREAILALSQSATLLDEWVMISEPQPLDTVLIRQRPWHVGVYVGRGAMLHMPEGLASVVEPFTTGRYADRVEGVYRHASRFRR